MTKTQRRAEQHLYDAAEDAFTSEGGGAVPVATSERQRVMDELSIRREGSRYEYSGYRYDLLSDAIAYARLVRSRSMQPVAALAQQQVSDLPR